MKLSNAQYLLKEGVKNIWHNRTMSFASVGVLVSCLLLTGASFLFSMNVNSAMESLESSNQVTVYMEDNLPTLKSVQVSSEIKKLPNVESCEFVSKEDALKTMMDSMGDDGTVFNSLMGDENPLNDVCKVSMKDLAEYKNTVKQIGDIEGVMKVRDYSDVAEKLTSLDNLVTMAGSWIIIILMLVSLFIIANTIRVTMFSRRLEISIMKSVGATNWFVRVPFVVEGVIIGVLSGGVASALLILLYDKTFQSITNIVPFFSPIPLAPLVFRIILYFILIGTVFGAVGGGISIGKYLRKEGGELVGW